MSPDLEELLREGVIQEASGNISLVSNLLLVAKPTSTYCLKSKIDKSLQVNSKQNLNRMSVTIDVRILNGYIDTAPSSFTKNLTNKK